MINLKYQNEVAQYNGKCNLDQFTQRARVAFRFSTEDITEPDNFMPMYFLSRRDRAHENLSENNCKGWALSCFDSEGQVKERLTQLKKRKNNIGQKLTHICSGILDEQDGISCDSNQIGHFDLFEFDNVDLTIKFTVIPIINP